MNPGLFCVWRLDFVDAGDCDGGHVEFAECEFGEGVGGVENHFGCDFLSGVCGEPAHDGAHGGVCNLSALVEGFSFSSDGGDEVAVFEHVGVGAVSVESEDGFSIMALDVSGGV